MLNIFSNDKDESAKKYRLGYIKFENNEKIPFKYRKLSRTDITENTYLKGVIFQDESFVIETKSSYKFDLRTKVLINNKQYSISALYSEEQENADGIFRKNMKPNKYLILRK